MDNINDALNYIHSFGMFSKKKNNDLSKMKYLCFLLGNPQNDFAAIHITGTNGKGSACAMCANILINAGFTTGRFISPYINIFNERISVDGNDITDDELISYTNKIKAVLEINITDEDLMPNEFEFNTVLAFLYFRDKKCEIAVLEVGLGGRLDPTNIIPSPLAAVIMSVSLDHIEILGDTVEKIAYEKCGIIKENSSVVLYPKNDNSVINIVKNYTADKNSGFYMTDTDKLKIKKQELGCNEFLYKGIEYKTSLSGMHQIYNALTVIEIFNSKKVKDFIKPKCENITDCVKKGLYETFFPARFEILSKTPLFILDGAHNESGINSLINSIKTLLPDKKIVLVTGMLKDKKPEKILRYIAPFADKIYTINVNSPRAVRNDELKNIMQSFNTNIECSDDLAELIEFLYKKTNDNEAVVFFGSLYLAGEIRTIIKT